MRQRCLARWQQQQAHTRQTSTCDCRLSATHALNRQACAEARKHKRQKRAQRRQRLLDLRKSDPARFARELRGREPEGPERVTPEEHLAHYEALLGGTGVAAPSTEGQTQDNTQHV